MKNEKKKSKQNWNLRVSNFYSHFRLFSLFPVFSFLCFEVSRGHRLSLSFELKSENSHEQDFLSFPFFLWISFLSFLSFLLLFWLFVFCCFSLKQYCCFVASVSYKKTLFWSIRNFNNSRFEFREFSRICCRKSCWLFPPQLSSFRIGNGIMMTSHLSRIKR